MSQHTNIAWCDSTFNPWIGCSKISPGCQFCYAETLDRNRFSKTLGDGTKENPVSHWGKGAPRRRTSEANWKLPLKWNKDAGWHSHECVVCGERFPSQSFSCCGEAIVPRNRPRVFCASLADWLDDEVPIEWLADLLKLIHDTPNLDWLLLTKRPENFAWRLDAIYYNFKNSDTEEYGLWLHSWLTGQKLPLNVWIGTTVEDQKRADERIPELLKIPAAVRFLSCEPLLGPVRLGKHNLHVPHLDMTNRTIDWVICGGESGKDARPMHPTWARSLRDQCAVAGVPFFFKQWGEYGLEECGECACIDGETCQRTKGKVISIQPTLVQVRVGKKAAGRQLDGREWNQFPTVEALA